MFFPGDYDAEFDAVFGDPGAACRPARRPTPPSSSPSADDPAVRPAGHEAWFVLVNAPRHGTGVGGGGLAPAGAGRRRTPTGSSTCWPRAALDVRDRLLFREIRTPADLADVGRRAGRRDLRHGQPRPDGLLRPANRGPVRGLFLVGGSAHPGGGLPMVMLSAAIVAAQIGPA